MAIEVFNRFENKYLVEGLPYARLTNRLGEYMEPDAYNQAQGGLSQVHNLYYDTRDFALIRRSLEKPAYKEKLRLRAYGTPRLQGGSFVEIKKKVGGLVNKRRTPMTLQAAYRFLETGQLPLLEPGINRQVAEEIRYLLSRLALAPAMYIGYQRRAYFALDGSDLRISFDRSLQYRREGLRLEVAAPCRPLLPKGCWLMEIKCTGGMPLWLTHLLSELRLYPVHFSKYGAAYQRCLREAPVFSRPMAAAPAILLPGHTQGGLRASIAPHFS